MRAQTVFAELTDSTGADVDFYTWRKNLQKLPNGKYQYVKPIDISGGSGIIEETSMLRYKKKTRTDIKPISDKRYEQLTIEARKNGAIIIRGGAEVEKHLDLMHADAATIGDVILFREDACLSEVLEETHHFMQNRIGMNNDKEEPLRTYLNEIEAKEFLLKNAKKYKIPRSETELTKQQLEHYKKKLLEYKEGAL